MIDLQHLPFPTPGVRLVTMRINGCLLIFISAPPTCSSSKGPVLAERLREHKEISSQIKPSLRLQRFPERTAQRCFTCADLFLKNGSECGSASRKSRRCIPGLLQ